MQPEPAYQSRQAPFGLKNALYSLVTTLGLAGSASAQDQAPQDHPPQTPPARRTEDTDSIDRRQQAPTILDTPLRLEYPTRTTLFGLGAAYEPQMHGGGLEGMFFSPYVAANGRWTDGTTRSQVQRTNEIYGAIGVGGSSADVELAPFYTESDDKRSERSGSFSTNSAGLRQETSQVQIDLDHVRRYGISASASFPLKFSGILHPYGRLLLAAYALRLEQDQRVRVFGSTHTTGTLVIPGVPQPVVIDNTSSFDRGAKVRRSQSVIDLSAAWDISYLFQPTNNDHPLMDLIVGVWGAYEETDVRATVPGDTNIVDDSQIRRSLGLQALCAMGHVNDGNIRFFTAGRAGADGGADAVDSSYRFTGEGLFMLHARPFDVKHQFSLAALASDRGGVERYGLTLCLMRLDPQTADSPLESEAEHRVRALERVFQRELSLTSGHDERFDDLTRLRMLRDLRTFELQGLEALTVGVGFDSTETDRFTGNLHVPLQYFDAGFPNIGLDVDGYWGHDARERGSGINQRDYGWSARAVWNPRLTTSQCIIYVGVERTGNAQGLDTSALFGVQLGFGDARPNYHELLEQQRSNRGSSRSREPDDE